MEIHIHVALIVKVNLAWGRGLKILHRLLKYHLTKESSILRAVITAQFSSQVTF